MDRAVEKGIEVLLWCLHGGGAGRALEDFAGFHKREAGETGEGIYGDEVTERPERGDASERGIDGRF